MITFWDVLGNSETQNSNDPTMQISVFPSQGTHLSRVFHVLSGVRFGRYFSSVFFFLPIFGAILGPWDLHVGALGRFLVETMQSKKYPPKSVKKSDARAAGVCGSGGVLIIN